MGRIYEDLHSKCCDVPLEDADANYKFVQAHPDTRWYKCTECGAYWGRQRMKGSWHVDPDSYTHNGAVKKIRGA